MRFRRKPVEIEAWKVEDIIQQAKGCWHSLPVPIKEAYEQRAMALCIHGIWVKTFSGLMFADQTEWIIQGVQGELYPCKANVFEATYEAVPEVV